MADMAVRLENGELLHDYAVRLTRERDEALAAGERAAAIAKQALDERDRLGAERRRWLAVLKRAASYLDCTLAGRNSEARELIAEVLAGEGPI